MSADARLFAPIVVSLIIVAIMWAGMAALERQERKERERRENLPKRTFRRGYDD